MIGRIRKSQWLDALAAHDANKARCTWFRSGLAPDISRGYPLEYVLRETVGPDVSITGAAGKAGNRRHRLGVGQNSSRTPSQRE